MTTPVLTNEQEKLAKALAWLRANPGGGTAAEVAVGIGLSPHSGNFVFTCLAQAERYGLVERAEAGRTAGKRRSALTWRAVTP